MTFSRFSVGLNLPLRHPAFGSLMGALGILFVALLLASPPALHGQSAGRLHGRITRSGGAPAVGVRVQVTSESGATADSRSNSQGLYSVPLPGSGSRFVVSTEFPGLSSVTRVLTRIPGVSDLVLDLTLEGVVQLEPLQIRVPRLTVETATRWTPGTVEQSRLGVELRNEPLEADGLSDLTSRQTGVAPSATPQGPGISIAGQAPDQTRLTLDGATLDGVVIPREAIRTVNVLANTFDVGRGQFTGGQVDVRTQQGANEWGATFRADVADRRLQYGGAPADLRPGSSRVVVDGGAGGGLIRDRLFVYGAFTGSRSTSDTRPLESLGSAGLRRLGLNPDSVERFLEVTRTLRPASNQMPDQESSLLSGLLRLDGVLGPRHSVMLRLNGQRAEAPQFQSPQATAGISSQLRRSNFGLLAQLSSGGARLANELRLQGSTSSRTYSSLDDAPAGSVEIATDDGDAVRDVSLFWFAGNPVAQRDVRQRLLELTDEVVLITPDRSHRLRLGVEGALQEYRSLPLATPGSFVFRSLEDLEAGRPALFTRALGTETREAEGKRLAVFLDDRWNSDALQLSYGLRIERSWYSSGQDSNPEIASRFGREPGEVPSSWQVSPRVGFAFQARMPWDRAPGASTGIQGGVGRFVGALALPELAAALWETGSDDAANLVCIGSDAPTPDWAAYRSDPSAIPITCSDGSAGVEDRLAQATLFSSGFVPPRAWRASLGGQGLAPGGIFWRLTGAALWGVDQPVAFDRNLRPTPAFLNAAEDGRAVYAEPAQIDPATGLVPSSASRRFGDLGTVRELTSEGRSRTFQVSASASRMYGTVSSQVGYTWTYAKETVGPLSAVGGSGASAGEDPTRSEWTTAPYTPRHMLYAAADWRRSGRLTVGLVGRLSSGTFFTPMVRGDANGDGTANDRAFVFDPGAGAGAGAGMAKLLDTAPERVRDCLAAQAGQVAAHNSCQTAPSLSLDFRARIQLGPRLKRSPYRRVTLWLVGRNLTSGLDHLLHGPDGLRNWGQAESVDNTLLTVRGFDPGSRQFQYDVNPRFGRPADRAFLYRTPFSFSIQARVAVGTDRVDAAFQKVIDANSNRDQVMTPENLARHHSQQIPHTAAEVLSLNGPRRLNLTPDQVVQLQQAADSVRERRAQLIKALVANIAATAGEPEGAAQADLTTLVREAVALRRAQMDTVRAILTPEQWRKLPPHLRVANNSFAPHPPERITAPSEY